MVFQMIFLIHNDLSKYILSLVRVFKMQPLSKVDKAKNFKGCMTMYV